jgi:prepilin peptidase CpaA
MVPANLPGWRMLRLGGAQFVGRRPLGSYRVHRLHEGRAVEQYLLIGALSVAAVGAVEDIRCGRIPNWLTYGGLLAALAAQFLMLGWPGLKSGLVGVLAGGGIFYLVFLVGGMGGGDVKLMAAVGAWAGAAQTVVVLIAAAITGGILAVGFMIFQRRVRVILLNTMELIRHHLTSGLRPHPVLNIREPGALRIPYGLAIALGTLYCLGRTFSWR